MKLMLLSDGPFEVGCFKTLSSYESTADLIDVTHEKCIIKCNDDGFRIAMIENVS